MIYDEVKSDRQIRQGDIFRRIPKLESMPLSKLSIKEEDGTDSETSWDKIVSSNKEVTMTLLPLQITDGIVITQDCDAERSKFICLAEIKTLAEVANFDPKNQLLENLVNNLTRKFKETVKFFYLPPGGLLNYSERMAADFRSLIILPREDLQNFIAYRSGALNEVASEHFRETIAQYFRRYPYNEWYLLSKDEVDAYEKKHGIKVERYEWNK